MGSDDERELLHILEVRGKDFLSSFATPIISSGNAEKSLPKEKKRKLEDDSAGEEEEGWTGFGDNESGDGPEVEDAEDDVSSDQSLAPPPKVVVFSDIVSTAGPSNVGASKAQMKAFMSSKVSKLTQDIQGTNPEQDGSDDDDEDELTNAQNDALLHRLVHTRLLSGSLNSELNLTSAQRKKALAGRVLETAGKAKLGKGEGAVRSAERNKAAKRVREGIAERQEERRKQELEEAKHLGNYHPTLKRLYDDSSDSKPRSKKREKGLGMGIGSFRGGILRLRKQDISSIQGSSGRGRGGGSRRRGVTRR
ncbi:predicted protein [Sparassis crispa]|uniref:Protein FAF1 n=1 Tax=Sparassis crispa TaxID=139825 RepID=A0A401GAW8_9APHY|nr:predicted protein [Sparassis crispa]GBE79326.1 predicted protein [Sparassis crispa]